MFPGGGRHGDGRNPVPVAPLPGGQTAPAHKSRTAPVGPVVGGQNLTAQALVVGAGPDRRSSRIAVRAD